ncbi:hypothetical protein [Endozoicomonas sp. ALC066]|uniref:hypothetical protein n=1 Tax=Endozoicomonas sp. ALC066 TaxID=3403078 RepID=UPI003BB569F9
MDIVVYAVDVECSTSFVVSAGEKEVELARLTTTEAFREKCPDIVERLKDYVAEELLKSVDKLIEKPL